MGDIWTPPSHQFRGVAEAKQAAQDYDSNLDFGFNEKTQQWCVFIKAGAMEASKDRDFPILGFKELPSREQVQKRLYQSDSLRRGFEILDDLQRHNDKLTETPGVADVDGQTAEAFEWGMRKMNHPNAPIKVYMGGNSGK